MSHLIFALFALAVSIGSLAGAIEMGRRTRRYHQQAARDFQCAAEYRREAAEIRAETEALRRQRRTH